jgi:hypothetical protein
MTRIEKARICMCVLVALGAAGQGRSAELSADQIVTAIAHQLVSCQKQDDPNAGSWPGEVEFMGTVTAGMACAYQWTGNVNYWVSAELGALFEVRSPDGTGNLMGDGAYSFVKMSEIEKPQAGAVDIWKNWLAEFYDSMRNPEYDEGSAEAYIRYFDNWDPSISVFEIAHHAVATAYIGDPDKDVWRNALIAHLSYVDDDAYFPVMALGVATWALAKTGQLDDTPISSDGKSSPYWEGVLLRDLPALLLSHQVPAGEPYEGSFYWRFDHTDGAGGPLVAGFTEDTVYGTVGLVATAALSESRDEGAEQAIVAANNALLNGTDATGKVYEHLSRQGETRCTFGGEMLQALWSVKQHLASAPAAETTPVAVLAER